jgi:hypothetical protein
MKLRGWLVFVAALLLGAAVAWLIPMGEKGNLADSSPKQNPAAAMPPPAIPAPATKENTGENAGEKPKAAPEALPSVPASTPPPVKPAVANTPPASPIPPQPEMRPVAKVPAVDTSPGRPDNSKPLPPDEMEAAAIQLDQVGLMLRDYRTLMGTNPTGTNAEIMQAIMGGNPRQAMLGPPEGQHLNGAGELVDRWGTPYFFHALSGTSMEIRSAGPDMRMYSNDDIVQH